MTTAFVRQLGAEAGVQLNPLRDNSEIPTQDNYDQVVATALKATRGRKDKPFKVNRSNIVRKLGKGQPKRINGLNESYLHVAEALNNGASATPVIVGGKIIGVSGLIGGSGYTKTPKVTIIDGGYGAQVIASTTSGVITDITINSGGDGYTGATTVSITDSGGTGTGATATVTKSDNVITGILTMPAGTGFKKTSAITVNNNASGTGLSLKITSVKAVLSRALKSLMAAVVIPERPPLKLMAKQARALPSRSRKR